MENLLDNDEVLLYNKISIILTEVNMGITIKEIEHLAKLARLNLSDEEKHYKLSFSDLGIENVRAVRDLWARKDIPKCENDVTVSLKPHSSEFFEIY